MTEKTKAVATRLTSTNMAKARDGLINRGIAPEDLVTISQILRLSVFLAITYCDDPESAPTDESLAIIT